MISLRALGALILLLASLSASAEEKTLKACGHPFYPPVSWISDHQLHGLAAEVSRQIFTELGYQITFVADYLWKRCLREVAEGRALREVCRGEAQNLKDREILEFLGEETG